METKKRSFKEVILGSHINELNSTWKLTIQVTNSQGVRAFGGYNVGPYYSPLTGNTVMNRSKDNKPINGYFIEVPEIIFKPNNKTVKGVEDGNNVAFLLGSPEVYVEGFPHLPEVFKNNKNGSRKIVLTNLDRQETDIIDYENEVDKIVGLLSADAGPKQVGLETLKHICAYVGLNYKDARYVNNKQALTKKLRHELKKFVRVQFTDLKKGLPSNVSKVKEAIEKSETAKLSYMLKELITFDVIEAKPGGFLYFNNQLIGQNISAAILNIQNDAELSDIIDIKFGELVKAKKSM